MLVKLHTQHYVTSCSSFITKAPEPRARSWTISPQNKWGKISLKGAVDTDGIDHFSPQKMGGIIIYILWTLDGCEILQHQMDD